MARWVAFALTALGFGAFMIAERSSPPPAPKIPGPLNPKSPAPPPASLVSNVLNAPDFVLAANSGPKSSVGVDGTWIYGVIRYPDGTYDAIWIDSMASTPDQIGKFAPPLKYVSSTRKSDGRYAMLASEGYCNTEPPIPKPILTVFQNGASVTYPGYNSGYQSNPPGPYDYMWIVTGTGADVLLSNNCNVNYGAGFGGAVAYDGKSLRALIDSTFMPRPPGPPTTT